MGCDIHLYKEKMVNGTWVTADEGWIDEYGEGCEDVPWKNRFTDRDYYLFGFLAAGVRVDHEYAFEPRGLPFNVCKQIKNMSDCYGDDGHSHSYLYLSELKDSVAFLKDKTVTVSGMKDSEGLEKLMESINSDNDTNWDLLYPYCKWSNSSGYEEFSVNVPALYKLSRIQKIIDLFNGIDGDNHRIVFWFDN